MEGFSYEFRITFHHSMDAMVCVVSCQHSDAWLALAVLDRATARDVQYRRTCPTYWMVFLAIPQASSSTMITLARYLMILAAICASPFYALWIAGGAIADWRDRHRSRCGRQGVLASSETGR